VEPIPVDLSGVPETLLWNLGRRAAARAGASLLDDPLAVELTGRLEYDFSDASQGAGWHAVRASRVSRPRAKVQRRVAYHGRGARPR
jgi:O-methyltransferase involved in polyketide biosynthesis